MMLNFRDFVNEKLDADQRLANKLFRKEVHALMSDKDANTLIQARSELDRWRDKYYKSDFRLEREAKEQQRKLLKLIKDVEKKYYDKYKDLKGAIVSDKLKDARVKMGVFD